MVGPIGQDWTATVELMWRLAAVNGKRKLTFPRAHHLEAAWLLPFSEKVKKLREELPYEPSLLDRRRRTGCGRRGRCACHLATIG